MNFLECTLDGNMARVDGAAIVLDEKLAVLGRKARGKLEVGIRPVHLELSSVPVENGVPVDLKSIDDQGSYRIITLKLAGKILRARLPEEKSIPDGTIWCVFPPQWTRLYADGRLVK